jgi:uncharacterized protein (DUF1778 family)
MRAAKNRSRSERLEVRTTLEDRELIDRAVAASNIDLTEFVVVNLRSAAQKVLADRSEFRLQPDAKEAWEAANRRPARTLSGLAKLMKRPSPFAK